jgi:glutathione peroxidase-family protein
MLDRAVPQDHGHDLDSGPPVWNFTKYLVGSDVRRLARWPTKVTLEDPQIIEALEAALRAG